MKLATYRDGSRDGQLIVVSRDLSAAHYATGIAMRLQQVLDDWNFLAPQLQDLYDHLNGGRARHAFAFDPRQCMAPLPRAYQWAGGVAYPSHLELAYRARQAELPASQRQAPLLWQGASDDLLGPCDPVVGVAEAQDIDFEAQLAVVTGDLPRGVSAERALEGIRLLMLANATCLRRTAPADRDPAWALQQPRVATAFSPVAVTPDELGEAWRHGRVELTLQCSWNGRKLGLCDTGPDMRFHFGQLIAQLASQRRLRAGSIIGSGPVSNPGVEGKAGTEWRRGASCIAEKRWMETLESGRPVTDFLRLGDTVRIEMKGRDGRSLFGAIDQEIGAPETP